jgi:hypothetical protein
VESFVREAVAPEREDFHKNAAGIENLHLSSEVPPELDGLHQGVKQMTVAFAIRQHTITRELIASLRAEGVYLEGEHMCSQEH